MGTIRSFGGGMRAMRYRVGVKAIGVTLALVIGTASALVPAANATVGAKPAPAPKPTISVSPKAPWYYGETVTVSVACHPAATEILLWAQTSAGPSGAKDFEVGSYSGSPIPVYATNLTLPLGDYTSFAFLATCAGPASKGLPKGITNLIDEYRGKILPQQVVADPKTFALVNPEFLSPDPSQVELYPFGTASVPYAGTCNSNSVVPDPSAVAVWVDSLPTVGPPDVVNLGGSAPFNANGTLFNGQLDVPHDAAGKAARGPLPWLYSLAPDCTYQAPPFPKNNPSLGGSYNAFGSGLYVEIFDPIFGPGGWKYWLSFALLAAVSKVALFSYQVPSGALVIPLPTTTTSTTTTTRPRSLPPVVPTSAPPPGTAPPLPPCKPIVIVPPLPGTCQ